MLQIYQSISPRSGGISRVIISYFLSLQIKLYSTEQLYRENYEKYLSLLITIFYII